MQAWLRGYDSSFRVKLAEHFMDKSVAEEPSLKRKRLLGLPRRASASNEETTGPEDSLRTPTRPITRRRQKTSDEPVSPALMLMNVGDTSVATSPATAAPVRPVIKYTLPKPKGKDG